jgi:hypothetical protein
MRKKSVVKRRAGCFQKVDNVRRLTRRKGMFSKGSSDGGAFGEIV